MDYDRSICAEYFGKSAFQKQIGETIVYAGHSYFDGVFTHSSFE